jgi:hypothetical protein
LIIILFYDHSLRPSLGNKLWLVTKKALHIIEFQELNNVLGLTVVSLIALIS